MSINKNYNFKNNRSIFILTGIIILLIYIFKILQNTLIYYEQKWIIYLQNLNSFNYNSFFLFKVIDIKVYLFCIYIIYINNSFINYNFYLIYVFLLQNSFIYMSLIFNTKRPYWLNKKIKTLNCYDFNPFPDINIINYFLIFIIIKDKNRSFHIFYIVFIYIYYIFLYFNGNMFIKDIILNFIILNILWKLQYILIKGKFLKKYIIRIYKKNRYYLLKFLMYMLIFYFSQQYIFYLLKFIIKDSYYKKIVIIDNYLNCLYKNDFDFNEKLVDLYFYFYEDNSIEINDLNLNIFLIFIIIYNLNKKQKISPGIFKFNSMFKVKVIKIIIALIFLFILLIYDYKIYKLDYINNQLFTLLKILSNFAYIGIIYFILEIIIWKIFLRKMKNKGYKIEKNSLDNKISENFL